jgi:hypothetical protein
MKRSKLSFTGSVKNFLYLYYKAPEQIVMNWTLRSPMVYLDEFMPFLSKRARAGNSKPAKDKKRGEAAADRLDYVLDKSTVRLNTYIDGLQYQKFTAKNITAIAVLGENHIRLRDASVEASGGRLHLNADLNQGDRNNQFSAEAALERMEVKSFFASFNNFGQDAVTDKNLRGNLDALANVRGTLSETGKIGPGSLQGILSFTLRNGGLKDFEPFQKISRFVFRRRNLSEVSFRDIKNTLRLEGNNIIIKRMLIESSAINMFVEGVYGIKGGTDINVDIPLRNPKKDELVEDDSIRLERSTRGIVIHLRATDGKDGKVNIGIVRSGKRHPDEE